MQTQTWTAAPYGSRWGVFKPSGELRCVVDSQNFAQLIADECEQDERPYTKREQRPYPRKTRRVREIFSGRIFGSVREAAEELDLNKNSIKSSINDKCRIFGFRFEFVDPPLKPMKVFDATAGIMYDSIPIAAEALGVCKDTVRAAINKGKTVSGHRLEKVEP